MGQCHGDGLVAFAARQKLENFAFPFKSAGVGHSCAPALVGPAPFCKILIILSSGREQPPSLRLQRAELRLQHPPGP